MPSTQNFRTSEEINGAHKEALRGAAVGAAKVRRFSQLQLFVFPESTAR
jgi:hypothetical protein